MDGSGNSSSPLVVLAVVATLAGVGAVGAAYRRGAEATGGINIIPAGIGVSFKTAEGEEVSYDGTGVIGLEAGVKYEYETENGEKGTFIAPEAGEVKALCFEGDYTEADDRARQIAEGSGTCMNNGGAESLVKIETEEGFEEEIEAALEAGVDDEGGEEE